MIEMADEQTPAEGSEANCQRRFSQAVETDSSAWRKKMLQERCKNNAGIMQEYMLFCQIGRAHV